MNTLLRVSGLCKALGERTLLAIESLELARGESYLLAGQNGAGKTTLLRIIAGLDAADAGVFEFDGKRHNRAEERIRLAPRVIYVHQHSYLFNTSVEENIAFGLRQQRLSGRERLAKVREVMRWAGVDHLSDVPPYRLSGGEKQRIALARAHVLSPELLLLDEPTSNLDDEAREQVAVLIRQMRDDNNCVLIATHDRDLMRLEHVISLNLQAGEIQRNGQGTPTG